MKIKEIISLALEEDIGTGDITTEYLDLAKKQTSAFIICKEGGILCGLDIAFQVFRQVDESLRCIAYKKDGDIVKRGETIAKIEGYSSSILQAERVSLNFLQRLSGIATLTWICVNTMLPHKAKLLDTRKTTPLLRGLEKYAVRVGGGYNHRFGLYDMILIKENHIFAAGSITAAVELVRRRNTSYRIEVEVTNMKEYKEAAKCYVDRIMLDNMKPEAVKKIVTRNAGRIELEVSGGIKINNIKEYAATGVDYISVGGITTENRSLDISLLFKEG